MFFPQNSSREHELAVPRYKLQCTPHKSQSTPTYQKEKKLFGPRIFHSLKMPVFVLPNSHFCTELVSNIDRPHPIFFLEESQHVQLAVLWPSRMKQVYAFRPRASHHYHPVSQIITVGIYAPNSASYKRLPLTSSLPSLHGV